MFLCSCCWVPLSRWRFQCTLKTSAVNFLSIPEHNFIALVYVTALCRKVQTSIYPLHCSAIYAAQGQQLILLVVREDKLVSPICPELTLHGSFATHSTQLSTHQSTSTTFDTTVGAKPQTALGHLDMYESDLVANQFQSHMETKPSSWRSRLAGDVVMYFVWFVFLVYFLN